jgi:hypothetical protein
MSDQNLSGSADNSEKNRASSEEELRKFIKRKKLQNKALKKIIDQLKADNKQKS